MGHENPRPDLLEQRRDHVRVQGGIEGARIGSDLAEVLVQRLRVAGELHAWEKVRPDAKAERAEPVLLVRRGRDRSSQRAATRTAASRLVDHVNRETATQEDVLEALAPIRRGFPRLRELPNAV